VFADVAPYVPAAPGNWTPTVPDDVAQALDLLAAGFAALNAAVAAILAQGDFTTGEDTPFVRLVEEDEEDAETDEDEGVSMGPLV
jgi:hypothetical protein